MTAQLQRFYSPQIQPAVVGMIADMTNYEAITRLVGDSGGLGFGIGVQVGSTEKSVIKGVTKFLGVTVRDITLDGTSLAIDTDVARDAVDIYGYQRNANILTRGRIWVRTAGNVADGDAVYCDANGIFGNSASGAAAAGSFTFSANPGTGKKLSIGTVDIVFYAVGATSPAAGSGASGAAGASGASGATAAIIGVQIGNTLADTMANLLAALNTASTAGNTQLNLLNYDLYPYFPAQGGGSGAYQLVFSAKTVGTLYNAINLSSDVTGVTANSTTLQGGSASATQVTNARWRSAAISSELAILSLFGAA